MAKAARAIHLLITLLPSESACGEARGGGGLGALSPEPSQMALNELTPRYYLAPASQCDNSSSKQRRDGHRGASNDGGGDDSTRLA